MEKISVILKDPNGDIETFCVESPYLSRLITNYKLYQKDMDFVYSYINEYGDSECVSPLPSSDGLIAIDMVNNLIFDSQGFTGINKMTPPEIKMSKNGRIVDETKENSVLTRFSQLFEAGYLKGFEEWADNGHHLNKRVCEVSLDELLDMIMETSAYGQFVFSTLPFKVETFCENDYVEQTELFNMFKKYELITESSWADWAVYLEKLK